MFILCLNAVNKELYKELYKWVLPTEDKERGKYSTKLKMSPITIYSI